MQLQIGCDWRC